MPARYRRYLSVEIRSLGAQGEDTWQMTCLRCRGSFPAASSHSVSQLSLPYARPHLPHPIGPSSRIVQLQLQLSSAVLYCTVLWLLANASRGILVIPSEIKFESLQRPTRPPELLILLMICHRVLCCPHCTPLGPSAACKWPIRRHHLEI